jgi:uridine kinase
MTVISKRENAFKIATKIIFDEAQNQTPVVVAVDGGSGAGKSIFVRHLAEETKAAVIPLDDFYSVEIPATKWGEYATREKLSKVFNWERLERTALRPLLQRSVASWTTYDFTEGIQKDGTYREKSTLQKLHPADTIIIDGTYSASPEIVDLIDITILIDVPIAERHRRLDNREEVAFLKQWHQQWDEVEDYYFNEIRPKEFYDLVIENF